MRKKVRHDENYDDPPPVGFCCVCGYEIDFCEDATEIAPNIFAHEYCVIGTGGKQQCVE